MRRRCGRRAIVEACTGWSPLLHHHCQTATAQFIEAYPSRTGCWISRRQGHSLPARRRAGVIVRRVKPTPGSQLALFATYSHARPTIPPSGSRAASPPTAPQHLRRASVGRADRTTRLTRLGAPPHFASAPALALGKPVQSRLGSIPSAASPLLTAHDRHSRHPAPARVCAAMSAFTTDHRERVIGTRSSIE